MALSVQLLLYRLDSRYSYYSTDWTVGTVTTLPTVQSVQLLLYRLDNLYCYYSTDWTVGTVTTLPTGQSRNLV